jgi:hypothetical protein
MNHSANIQNTAASGGRARRRRMRVILAGIGYVITLGVFAAAAAGIIMHIPHAKVAITASKSKRSASSEQTGPVIIVQQNGCRQAEFDNSSGRLTDSQPVSCNDVSSDRGPSGNRLERIKQGFFGHSAN